MVAFALAGFVAGVFILQQQSALPAGRLVATLAAAALAAALFAWRLVGRVQAREEVRKEVRKGVRPTRWAVACVSIGAAAALGYAWAAFLAMARLDDTLAFADEGKDVRVIGIVASLPAQLERGRRFEFDVESVQTPGVHVPARISLGWYAQMIDVKPAQRWAFTVRLKRPHGGINPGGFDFEGWMLERSLRAGGYVRDGHDDEAPRLVDAMVWSVGGVVDRLRHELRARLQQRLDGQRYGGVLIALILGDQRAIREDDWTVFNRTGISHLVSISGLHITMIAGLAAAVVSGLWRRSRYLLPRAPAQTAAAVAAVLAALAYCLLAGWGVPAQRTFFMLATVALALMLRWSVRPSTTLALAAAVVCMIDPWAVIAPGFWLSFGAVAAIFLVVAGRPAAGGGWRGRLREAGRIQAAVTLALVPMTVMLFQQLSVVSPLANAIAIPLVSLVVTPLALLGGVFVALPEPLASLAVPCLVFAHWLFELLGAGLLWVVGFGWASVAVAAPPVWTIVPAALGVLWLLAPRGWPVRWVAVTWFVPMFVWPPARPGPGDLWVTALDIGQGMSLLVETHEHTMLYDTGPRYSTETDAGARVIAPYFRYRGIDRLDLLVVSHLDSDHSGGTAAVLRSVPVAAVWSSIRPDHAMFNGAPVVERCQAGKSTALGDATVRALHPLADDYARPGLSTNAMSCVVEVRAGPHRVLLTGDLPAKQEQQLIERGAEIASTLLTAPHHGSRSSSSELFVAAVQPNWVVVQAGYRNRFGHPAAEVVARYAANGSTLVRTDYAGASQWRMQANGAVEVEAWRQQHARYWHNRPQPRYPQRQDRPGGEADDDLPSMQAEPQADELRPF